jgi:hypothetical protein
MLLRQFAGSIFHVTHGVVDVTLSLVELPFGLKLFVISELAGRFLDASLCFIGSALHMFAVHLHLLTIAASSTQETLGRSDLITPAGGRGNGLL